MKWRVPGQEVDQNKLGDIVEKDCQAHGLNREKAGTRRNINPLTPVMVISHPLSIPVQFTCL